MRPGSGTAAFVQIARTCALIVSALLLFVFAAAPALAQTRSQPVPVVLSHVRLISESATESRLELAFDPQATSFAPIASQPTQPPNGFALTTRGPSAVQPSGTRGV